MNYNEFIQETRLFFNRAMDIYSTIKDKSITKDVKDITRIKNYEFTKLDKKVLSLFIAGFLVEGNLKEIFSQYDDIELDKFFDFIDIKESDISSISNDQYKEFFERNFKLDLISIIKESNRTKEINFITPEVVISSLQYTSLSGSKILDYFSKKYEIGSNVFGLSDHPIFRALENYTLIDGSVNKKDFSKGNNIGRSSLLFNFSPDKRNVAKTSEQLNKKQLSSINFDDESIWLLLDEIQKSLLDKK